MDNLTPEQRKKNMKAIRSQGSKIELMFAKEMWSRGLRYRKNCKSILGTPDFAFKALKIAVFCDSEFWHGKNWEHEKEWIKTNSGYWTAKIERNIRRDETVTNQLRSEGWIVFRFWEKDITTNLHECVDEVEKIIEKRKK